MKIRSGGIVRLLIISVLIFPLQANIPIGSGVFAPAPELIYVDASATGANNGTSWADAYIYLQDALDETNASGSTDFEIRVAEGVYYPDEDKSPHNHTNDSDSEFFHIKYNNVKLYGGFPSGGSSWSERDWMTNQTILSGDVDGNDTNLDGNYIAEDWNDIVGDNAFHVVLLDGATNEDITSYTVVDGFIITAGEADAAAGNKFGGGLECFAAGSIPPAGECSPILRNLTIQGNRAVTGGGVMLYTNYTGISNPQMTNISIIGNLATADGGGMFVFVANDASGQSNPVLVNVSFRNNYAESDGGGFANSIHMGTGNPILTNVEFYNNEAVAKGGGLYASLNTGTSNLTLTNVSFNSNQASEGGAIYNYQVSGTLGMDLNNAILWGDSASSSGSEIFNNSAVPVISSSDIQGCGGSTSWVAAFGTDNGGNLDVNPHFTSSAGGDLTLQYTSSAINAGNQALLPLDTTDLDQDDNFGETLPLDLAMNTRVVNGDVDMGAYEYFLDVTDHIGFYKPGDKSWYLKEANDNGWVNITTIRFGSTDTSWVPVVGDWNSNDQQNIGLYSPAQKTWYINYLNVDGWGAVNTYRFGSTDPSWIPVVGDWSGIDLDRMGMYSRTQKTWYLKDSNNDGWSNVTTVRFGSVDSSWLPVVGDWNGDGTDTIGMYSRTQKTWYLKEANTDGWSNVVTVRFGSTDPTWVPVVGDWDGDGIDTIGMYSRTQKTWYLKEANTDGWSNVVTVRFGSTDSSWVPVKGRW
jgi:hypothetical protein